MFWQFLSLDLSKKLESILLNVKIFPRLFSTKINKNHPAHGMIILSQKIQAGGTAMFKKLHLKLIFTFTLLIVISLSTLSVINYGQVSRQMNNEVRENASEQANELKDLIDLYLTLYSLSIEQFSKDYTLLQFTNPVNTEEERKSAWNHLKNNFTNYLDIYPEIQFIYIGDEKKNMDLVPHIDLTGFDPTTRPWYTTAMQTPNQVIWTEPYIDEATNEYVITAAKAIQHGSNETGVIGIDISLDELETIVSEINVNHNGYVFLLDQSGKALVHPTLRGEDLSDLPFIQQMYQSSASGVIDYEFEAIDRMLVYDSLATTGWKVGTVYLNQELMSTANRLRNINVLISAIVIAVSTVITYFISINISRPISKLTKEVAKVANGDFTVTFTSQSKDEVGRLSDGFNRMISNTRDLIEAVKNSSTVIGTSSENLSAISEETTASNEEVARAVSEIANGATVVASTCDDTNQRTNELSLLIQKVTNQVATMEQLSSDTRHENNKGLIEVEKLKKTAIESNDVIISVESVIQKLSTKINEIGNIMKAISNISEQTNLLALNASIEAARAGEHGKGFAVVANEVRKLADESNKATEEVRQTLLTIQTESEHAVNEMAKAKVISNEQSRSVTSTEHTFTAMSNVTKKMIRSIETISTNVHEVDSFKEEVLSSIQQISSMIEESAAASEQVSASAEEQITAIQAVAEQAQQLRQSSEELELLIQKFKLD